MTIELKPEQSRVIDLAIAAGLIEHPDEVVNVGVDALRDRLESKTSAPERTRSIIARQRIRELPKGVTLGGIPIRELIEEGRE
jgi:hypothetical protein